MNAAGSPLATTTLTPAVFGLGYGGYSGGMNIGTPNGASFRLDAIVRDSAGNAISLSSNVLPIDNPTPTPPATPTSTPIATPTPTAASSPQAPILAPPAGQAALKHNDVVLFTGPSTGVASIDSASLVLLNAAGSPLATTTLSSAVFGLGYGGYSGGVNIGTPNGASFRLDAIVRDHAGDASSLSSNVLPIDNPTPTTATPTSG